MIRTLLLLAFVAIEVRCQALSTNNTLHCRLCNSASTLSDCNKLQTCDPTTEECYMDQLVTDQLSIVYNAGCRAKSMCASIMRGRRSDQVACSRCCNFRDDCNRRLCGIKDDTLSSFDCYSCDHRTFEQSTVWDLKHCVTLETCQPNEVCYATQHDLAGVDTFFYGCLNKMQCQLLMKRTYEHYAMCVKNDTSRLPLGSTWDQSCGLTLIGTTVCHSCCADGGCNYGTCSELNERIFRLLDLGHFDLTTLKVI